jgi:NADH-quinone oxidoreductase subunit M
MPLTTLVATLPAVAALFASCTRRFAVGASTVVFLSTLAASSAWYVSSESRVTDRFDPGRLLGHEPLFAVDAVNALLLPFGALIFLFVLLVQPSRDLSQRSLRRVLIAEAVTLAAFMSSHPVVLAALWCLSVAGGWWELRAQGEVGRGPARIFCWYMLPSCALVLLGAGLMTAEIGGAAAVLLVAIAVMIRKGIVPLHSWLPDLFGRAPLPLSVLFNAPQIGAWVAVRVVAPRAPLWILEMISFAALLTAVHGAGMALVQTSPRRVLGWLFLSQSALILVGLESQASVAQAGGLAMWISSGLALTGFGMTLSALEARRGPLSLLRFDGGYERKPLLAVCFLTLGLASAGFPGTLGFVAQEALVHGVVKDFPYLGFAILVASMLNGITVLRMYFTLFCGRIDPDRVPQPLQPREQLGFVILVVLLVAAGVYPRPFLWSQAAAVEEIGGWTIRQVASISWPQ